MYYSSKEQCWYFSLINVPYFCALYLLVWSNCASHKPSGKLHQSIELWSIRLNRGFCFYSGCLVVHTWLFTDLPSLQGQRKCASRLHWQLVDKINFPWLSEQLSHYPSLNTTQKTKDLLLDQPFKWSLILFLK